MVAFQQLYSGQSTGKIYGLRSFTEIAKFNQGIMLYLFNEGRIIVGRGYYGYPGAKRQ